MEQLDMAQYEIALAEEALVAGSKRGHGLTLLAPPAAPQARSATQPSIAQQAAAARARHALLRSAQEFLDREGFVETPVAPAAELAAALGRVCWTASAGKVLAGRIDGATLGDMLDLFERLLASIMQGTINRARADLRALNVDLEMLKYVRLPVRRLTPAAALELLAETDARNGDYDAALLASCGEPLFICRNGEPEGATAACRLLLPGVGAVARGEAGGDFSVDLAVLADFALGAHCARLARPGLMRGN